MIGGFEAILLILVLILMLTLRNLNLFLPFFFGYKSFICNFFLLNIFFRTFIINMQLRFFDSFLLVFDFKHDRLKGRLNLV